MSQTYLSLLHILVSHITLLVCSNHFCFIHTFSAIGLEVGPLGLRILHMTGATLFSMTLILDGKKCGYRLTLTGTER